jgi:hypothetical protein
MTRNHFGWDTANGRPILRVDDGRAVHGVEMVAYGADDPEADTMFCIKVSNRGGEKERIVTMRPEPMQMGFLRDILRAGSFTLEVDSVQEGINVDEKRAERLKQVKYELETSQSPML